jgi:uncharacterized protein YkwD
MIPSAKGRFVPALFFAAALLSLALAGCGALPVGPGGGASASGAPILAHIRAESGLAALAPDSRLERAALEQARNMARSGEMSHATGWGKGFVARMRRDGIGGVRGENIAYGRFDTAKVFDVWLNSPPHRRNMLDPRFTRFGLAYVEDGSGSGRRYWALVLGSG